MKIPFINKNKNISITSGELRVCVEKAKIKIFFDSQEITKDVGLNTSLRLFEQWYDSSKTKTQVMKISNSELKITSYWENMNLWQIWKIQLADSNNITWTISMNTPEERIIDECKLSIMLSDKYTHWLNTQERKKFARINNSWQSIKIHEEQNSFLAAEYSPLSQDHKHRPLPAILFDYAVNEGPFFPKIETAPKDISAHVLSLSSPGIRNTLFYSGFQHIASVNIRIFDNKTEFDDYIKAANKKNNVSAYKNMFLDTKEKPDILLVMPPPWQTKMPPLGLAYLCSYVTKHGFNVKAADLNLNFFDQALGREKDLWDISIINVFCQDLILEYFQKYFGRLIKKFADEVIESDIKVIGFSVNFLSLLIAEHIAELIKLKDRSRIIIFGGPGCFWPYDKKFLTKNIVDYFVIGEGEKPLIRLLNDIYNTPQEKTQKTDHLENTTSNKSQGVNISKTVSSCDKTQARSLKSEPIKDIDKIPYPKFTNFAVSEYNKDKELKALPLLMSRGCIGKCSYCIDHHMVSPFRIRSAEKIVEELEFHLKYHRIKNFEFNDLLCNGDIKQLESFCDLVIAKKLDINWVSYAMIRKQMTAALLKKMRRAGCVDLCYGLESGSDTILKKMNKYFTSKEAEEVIRNTHRAGINTRINIIVGYPMETEKHFQQTLQFIRRNKSYIDEITNISELVVNIGSDMGKNQEKHGVVIKNQNNTQVWYDENGLDSITRRKRVNRVINLVHKLGIKTQIINCPELI